MGRRGSWEITEECACHLMLHMMIIVFQVIDGVCKIKKRFDSVSHVKSYTAQKWGLAS